MSTIEENKAIIRRYREAHNANNLDALDAIVAKDVISHNALPGYRLDWRVARWRISLPGSFPDIQTKTEHLVAEGDKVIEWYSAHGTNTGEFMGMPPTGKKFEIPSIVVYRLANGKIVETWGLNDGQGLLQQLGMLPMPG